MNMLYDEECLKFRHKDFEKSYDLMAKEKHVILGMNLSYTYINSKEEKQTFWSVLCYLLNKT